MNQERLQQIIELCRKEHGSTARVTSIDVSLDSLVEAVVQLANSQPDTLTITSKEADVTFQQSVREWCVDLFGEDVANNIDTRCKRFFEEAGELCQSLGMTKTAALRLVEYTWSRPVGEPRQELGGVMVTLAALAQPAGLLMRECGWLEYIRVNQPEVKAKIRAKQAAKNAMLSDPDDSLPGNADIGKFVTLQLAQKITTGDPMGLWLPQQTVWRILAEDRDALSEYWIVDDPRYEVGAYTGEFRFAKNVCSTPRGAA